MTRNVEVTAADVQGLALKLSDFIDTLTPGERNAFQIVEWYLALSALEEEHEVSGYMAVSPGDHAGFWQAVTTALVARREAGTHA
jgi:hypothetical protein